MRASEDEMVWAVILVAVFAAVIGGFAIGWLVSHSLF
jgi:hypothetical protein